MYRLSSTPTKTPRLGPELTGSIAPPTQQTTWTTNKLLGLDAKQHSRTTKACISFEGSPHEENRKRQFPIHGLRDKGAADRIRIQFAQLLRHTQANKNNPFVRLLLYKHALWQAADLGTVQDSSPTNQEDLLRLRLGTLRLLRNGQHDKARERLRKDKAMRERIVDNDGHIDQQKLQTLITEQIATQHLATDSANQQQDNQQLDTQICRSQTKNSYSWKAVQKLQGSNKCPALVIEDEQGNPQTTAEETARLLNSHWKQVFQAKATDHQLRQQWQGEHEEYQQKLQQQGHNKWKAFQETTPNNGRSLEATLSKP